MHRQDGRHEFSSAGGDRSSRSFKRRVSSTELSGLKDFDAMTSPLSMCRRVRPRFLCARQDRGHRSCCCNRQLALGGLRFFSTSASVIIIIIGSTGHS